MGSYWAYYELGWGGWWFWDPVENASLHALARRHGAAALRGRDGEARRAEGLDDPARDPRLLALARSAPSSSARACSPRCTPSRPTRPAACSSSRILVLFIGGCLALYAWRAPLLKQGGLFAPVSREGVLVFNNLFLATACATVFIGTLYPLALEVLDRSEDLGRRALLQPDLRAAVPAAARRRAVRADAGLEARRPPRRGAAALRRPRARARRGRGDLCDRRRGPCWRPSSSGLPSSSWPEPSAELAERTQLFAVPRRRRRCAGARPAALRLGHRARPFRAWRQPARHRCETQWGAERIASVKPGQTLELRGYELRFDGARARARGRTTASSRQVHGAAGRRNDRRHGAGKAQLPGARERDHRGRAHDSGLQPALSVARRRRRRRRRSTCALYHKPLVLLIWLGAVVMALGGALSLSDRRLRVGAPKPARMRRVLQPAE